MRLMPAQLRHAACRHLPTEDEPDPKRLVRCRYLMFMGTPDGSVKHWPEALVDWWVLHLGMSTFIQLPYACTSMYISAEVEVDHGRRYMGGGGAGWGWNFVNIYICDSHFFGCLWTNDPPPSTFEMTLSLLDRNLRPWSGHECLCLLSSFYPCPLTSCPRPSTHSLGLYICSLLILSI